MVRRNNEEYHRYDDILHLPHHVSSVHPQMPLAERAAQFAPFAALAGFEEAVREAEEAFREKEGTSPTVAQVAKLLSVPVEKAALALGVSQAPVSLSGDESGELEIPVEAPEEKMTERLTLYELLHTLEERDKKLLEYRYFQGKTQTVTAGLLGMTQVQVSRREKKLLLYLRQELMEK